MCNTTNRSKLTFIVATVLTVIYASSLISISPSTMAENMTTADNIMAENMTTADNIMAENMTTADNIMAENMTTADNIMK